MKHRLLRVKELLKRELSDLVQKDFVFENALVTINEVDVTPDLRQGHVYVGVIGNAAQQQKALDALESKRGMIQKKMAQRVVLKFTPQLHFKLDNSVERGVNVISIMDGLNVPDEPVEPEEFSGAGEDLEEFE